MEGQIELINRLITKEELKLQQINLTKQFRQSNFVEEINKIKIELENINKEIIKQIEYRRELWNKLEEKKSKAIAEAELIKRFNLLKETYKSDLERLSFVLEGNYYFSQLNTVLCPFCNRPMDEKCIEHDQGPINPSTNLITSIEAEIEKINAKLKDLKSTIYQAKSDYEDLKKEIEQYQNDYNLIKDKIDSYLQPQQIKLKSLLDNYLKERDVQKKYDTINEKIQDLKKEKEIINKLLGKPQKSKLAFEGDEFEKVSSINEFCTYMSNTLKRWNFPKDTKVSYDNGKFYINSKETKDYGKGIRAIIYSGFAISILEYCKAKNKPHPGFVIIDSPLTTYKGRKSEEELNEDIQQAFFKDLTSLGDNFQIIIFDNKEPKDEVKQKINIVEFTKDINHGRYGFFPLKD